jgi:hypothetical protein
VSSNDGDVIYQGTAGGGPCPLFVFDITSTSPDFLVPGVISYPLVISAGGVIALPVRFQPRVLGPATATLTVFSNDVTGSATVDVSGLAPPPRLNLSIADSGSFGDVCVGSFRDEPLTVANSGRCPLTITGITSSSPVFLVSDVDPLLPRPAPALPQLHDRGEPVPRHAAPGLLSRGPPPVRSDLRCGGVLRARCRNRRSGDAATDVLRDRIPGPYVAVGAQVLGRPAATGDAARWKLVTR